MTKIYNALEIAAKAKRSWEDQLEENQRKVERNYKRSAGADTVIDAMTGEFESRIRNEFPIGQAEINFLVYDTPNEADIQEAKKEIESLGFTVSYEKKPNNFDCGMWSITVKW